MNHYATHLPLLLTTLQRTRGPILEFGSGVYSTPVIHAFACNGRYARSLESDSSWYERSKHFSDGVNHDVMHVADWEEAKFQDVRWSVALIDHEIPRRMPDLLRVRRFANYILIHDTESQAYAIDEAIRSFRFRLHDRRFSPHTTIVSDYFKLDWVCKLARS